MYGFSMKKLIEKLSEIKIAVVQEKESKKSKIIVEEMDTKQASLFSFLKMENICHINKIVIVWILLLLGIHKQSQRITENHHL